MRERNQEYNASNSARCYIRDSKFSDKAPSLSLNLRTAVDLRSHVNSKVKWAKLYRSAVDNVVNGSSNHNPNTPAPYVGFAEVSRVNDACCILQANTMTPRTQLLLFPRIAQVLDHVICHSLWSTAYETLQFPLLFLHVEAGWSKGNRHED